VASSNVAYDRANGASNVMSDDHSNLPPRAKTRRKERAPRALFEESFRPMPLESVADNSSPSRGLARDGWTTGPSTDAPSARHWRQSTLAHTRLSGLCAPSHAACARPLIATRRQRVRSNRLSTHAKKGCLEAAAGSRTRAPKHGPRASAIDKGLPAPLRAALGAPAKAIPESWHPIFAENQP